MKFTETPILSKCQMAFLVHLKIREQVVELYNYSFVNVSQYEERNLDYL